MASTSNIKKSNHQRNSSSTNCNDPPFLRQILPMLRPTITTTQGGVAYSQAQQQSPQIIVPTQYGFGELLSNSNSQSSKDMSSTLTPIPHFLPMDYGNMQTNYFGPVQPYPTYFPQQLYHQSMHHQHFSQMQQQHSQAMQQPFMSHVQMSQQQAGSAQQDPQFDMSAISTFCDDCTNLLINNGISADALIYQSICNKCKSKYVGMNSYRNPAAPPMLQQSSPSQPPQPQLQNVQQASRVVPRSMSQQSLNVMPLDSMSQNVSQSISDYSMSTNLSNPNDLPIDFSLHQSPTICYEDSCDRNSCSKNSVLNDVFFSDPMIEDTEELLHCDSDSSSDTDIATPRQRFSPPLTPTDYMSGENLLWSMIYDDFDLSNNKSSETSSSTNASESVISSSQVFNSYSPPPVKLELSTPTTMSTVTSPLNSACNAFEGTIDGTIDPTLICSNTGTSFGSDSSNFNEVSKTIDPRFIETSPNVSSHNVTKKPTPVITNYVEFGDVMPSPPLETPELVSDHSLKRRMTYESSSEDDSSDAESSDKRSQKKLRVDNGDCTDISSSYSNDHDNSIEPANETNEISDTVTDEYHYSSDTDSEEDDDEEYRPTNTNKKSRTTRKVAKSQGKARGSLSKGSAKPKSGVAKNKSKASTAKRGKQSSKSSKPPSKRSSRVNSPTAVSVESPAPQSLLTPEESQEMERHEVTSPRPTLFPTIFQTLTRSGIDWCRYCGTTEGVNWRPGPWGKRTLCNKHGCDYKGYGFACKLPRLDLTGFVNESVEDRDRPVLQLFCTVCQKQESFVGNVLVRCEGCPKAFHQKCSSSHITDETVSSSEQWFCEAGCSDNVRRKRIVVELPRKKLPLMSTPKVQAQASNIETGVVPSGTVSRPRTSRNSSRV
ncbi:4794_t:CDS:2 [Funneliformis mosseae]|uniref:4794_t:CDS:1 n=1 Tax=Funneliformis mosseae TaxID=27381 RepID=A0A9N8VS54_FUNMO|nr:4794_t:CDS:2 [Funneliformis mosseae]